MQNYFSIINNLAVSWFSPGTPVSSTNKTDCNNIAEILSKVALQTIYLNPLDVSFFLQNYCCEGLAKLLI
jgi:hypothetical protein